MWPFGKKTRLSREQALDARPLRAVEAALTLKDDGSARLAVPVRPRKGFAWLIRTPEGPPRTKTFELDPLGLLVWQHCDGKTSVQQIIRKLAKQYNLNLREAEIPTVSFLRLLARKGLVVFAMPGGQPPGNATP